MGSTSLFLIFGCILSLSMKSVHSKCTISSDWRPISRDVRLLMSSAVVYGKTKEHKASQVKVDGKPFYVINAVFDVYCILKQGTEHIPEEITIQRIAPRDGCSGTTQNMKIGEEAIVAIKPTSNGEFEYDEAMPTMSGTFPAIKNNFISLSSVCDLQSWKAPVNARFDRCPICGVSNFTEDVMATSQNGKAPCVFDGTDFSNVSNCETYSTIEIEMSATCIPINFNNTCTKVLYSQSSVTCSCDGKTPRPTGGFTEIDAGHTAFPGIVTIFFCFCMSILLLS